jgi:hypothetical protein
MIVHKKPVAAVAFVCLCGLAFAFGSSSVPTCPYADSQGSPSVANASPAYHKHGPSAALPATLDAKQFANDRRAFVAYTLASRIPDILYQQPCFCRCNTFAGHESLFDCFRERHASWCYGCESETVFCYEKQKAGQTAAKIRKALLRGDWKSLDLDQYVERVYAQLPGAPNKSEQ